MEKKVRNQFLIGGLIMLVGIGMYFSGINVNTLLLFQTQEDSITYPWQCEIVGRQGGDGQGLEYKDCDESSVQKLTIPVIILIIGMVFMIRGIMTMRSSL